MYKKEEINEFAYKTFQINDNKSINLEKNN